MKLCGIFAGAYKSGWLKSSSMSPSIASMTHNLSINKTIIFYKTGVVFHSLSIVCPTDLMSVTEAEARWVP